MKCLVKEEIKKDICPKQKAAIKLIDNYYGNTAVVVSLVEDKKFNPLQIIVKDNGAHNYVAFLSLKDINGLYHICEFENFNENTIKKSIIANLKNGTNRWIKKVNDEMNKEITK